MCIKRACAQIFWEDLGEENMPQQRGGGPEGYLSFFMRCVITTVQNPALQPAHAKDPLISFRLCHGERKEATSSSPNYDSSDFLFLYFPPKIDINLISVLSSASLIIYTQALRAAARGS